MSQWSGDPERRSPSDLELVERTRSGEPGAARMAASELLARHQRKVYLWCQRYTGDHERALELSQEALLRAFRGLDGFSGRSSFGSWLFVVTRNQCLNALERRELTIEAGAEPDAMPARGLDPEELALGRIEAKAFLGLLRRKLSAVEQRALWLRVHERMPVDMIGELLGITGRSGARSVLQSARRKLAAALEARERNERRELR